jgi:hypothetical protein
LMASQFGTFSLSFNLSSYTRHTDILCFLPQYTVEV